MFWEYIVPDSVESYPADHVPVSTDGLPDGVEPADPSVSPKYFEDYCSLGTEPGSVKSDSRPAWVQDLGASAEREGRAQSKEGLMGWFRDLDYI